MTRTGTKEKVKKRTRTVTFSPRQLANQYNFSYNGRIKGHCIDLGNVLKAFNRPDLLEDLRALQHAMEKELEKRVEAIKKGGERVI